MKGLSWPGVTTVVVAVAALGAALQLTTAAGELAARTPQAIALAATLLVVIHLAPGDPPRRPWGLMALANALILGAALAHAWQLPGESMRGRHVLLVLGNVVGPAALILFVRLFARAGLAPKAGTGERALLALAAVAAGLHAATAIGTRAAHLPARPTAQDLGLVAAVAASSVGDAVSFVASLRLVSVVRGMAGGIAARPYLLIAVNGAFFLALDLGIAMTGAETYAELGAWLRYLPSVGWGLATAAALAMVTLLRQARRV